MSDVSLAKAGWFGRTGFLIVVPLAWLWGLRPVVLTRNRYEQLRDNELMLEYAHKALQENRRLRNKYEPEREVTICKTRP